MFIYSLLLLLRQTWQNIPHKQKHQFCTPDLFPRHISPFPSQMYRAGIKQVRRLSYDSLIYMYVQCTRTYSISNGASFCVINRRSFEAGNPQVWLVKKNNAPSGVVPLSVPAWRRMRNISLKTSTQAYLMREREKVCILFSPELTFKNLPHMCGNHAEFPWKSVLLLKGTLAEEVN